MSTKNAGGDGSTERRYGMWPVDAIKPTKIVGNPLYTNRGKLVGTAKLISYSDEIIVYVELCEEHEGREFMKTTYENLTEENIDVKLN